MFRGLPRRDARAPRPPTARIPTLISKPTLTHLHHRTPGTSAQPWSPSTACSWSRRTGARSSAELCGRYGWTQGRDALRVPRRTNVPVSSVPICYGWPARGEGAAAAPPPHEPAAEAAARAVNLAELQVQRVDPGGRVCHCDIQKQGALCPRLSPARNIPQPRH